jgi:hypothetical protein
VHRHTEGEDLGLVWVSAGNHDAEEAFEIASDTVNARASAIGDTVPVVVGEFFLAPRGGPPTRDFQTFHFDFGLPLNPRVEQDIGRYTALYVPQDFREVSAVTRLVPLARLLAQRPWPPAHELLGRLVAYGETWGAWDEECGYTEGSLARLVEAADGSRFLPSVKDSGFLCGMEFDDLRSEIRFFGEHSLDVQAVVIEVALRPGEMLVFDNLAVAHGRSGTRRAGELRQWVFGDRGLGLAQQYEIRDRVLATFDGSHSYAAQAFGTDLCSVGGDEVAAF